MDIIRDDVWVSLEMMYGVSLEMMYDHDHG